MIIGTWAKHYDTKTMIMIAEINERLE
jgi:hypothetical protein